MNAPDRERTEPRASLPSNRARRTPALRGIATIAIAMLSCFLAGPIQGREPLPGEVVLSEIQPSGGAILDEDGDASDWIEIENRAFEDLDLGGLYLTDSAADPTRWELPELSLAPGARILIFASGKDRRDPAGELHTSFRLERDGEYLALTGRDGATVIHDYFPSYPSQRGERSYGLWESGTELVGRRTPIEALVPLDDALGTTWTTAGFVPGPEWLRGPGGAGYVETDAASPEGLVAYFPFDGDVDDALGANPGTFRGGAPLFVADRNGEAGGALRLDGVDDYVEVAQRSGLPLYSNTAYSVSLWARGSAQPDRRVFAEGSRTSNDPVLTLGTQAPGATGQFDFYLRDRSGVPLKNHTYSARNAFDGEWHHIVFTDEGGDVVVYIDGVRDPTDFSYAKRPIDFDRTSIGALLRAQPTFHFDGDLDDVSLWSRALSADEVLELSRGRSPLALGGSPLARSIGVDLREAMRGVSSSAYVRAPFTVESLRPWDRLVLAIAYDDGFVAYLNGVEIARRNAPASVGWTSSAMIERDPLAAMAFETIDASDAAALLVEGDNVLAVHALNARADDDELLVAFELVASGGGELAEGFFADATPGAPNTSPPLRFVADTRFSVDRGLYEAPIVVAISCDTREAEIRFTLDGSVPTPANGFVYEGPIRIETTTTLRAAAFLDGHEPSNVDTQTYIFVEDVLGQTRPDGYPGAWAGFTADYDMDPRIVEDPSYAPSMVEALESLPTVSLVLDRDDLFGPTGIYQNPTQGGRGWERPGSVELLFPDGRREGFQIDAGVRISGNRSRNPANSQKHGFRLAFRGEYGAPKLRHRLFDDSPVERFDTIVLRPNAFDSWVSVDASQRQTAQYIRDQWVREAQRDVGQLTVHGFFVHLYLNGLYWGVYNLTERPDASYGAEYLGGDKEDYDAVKNHEELVDGSIDAYRELDQLRATNLSRIESYRAILDLIDATSLADYMIVNMFAPSEDWPGNYYMLRKREPGAGFKFFSWDSEYAFLHGVENNRTLEHWRDADSPTKFYHAMRRNEEFRVLFGDRLHRHFFHDGALTPEAVASRWLRNVESIELALLAESARWGDNRRATPYTPDREWRAETERLLTGYFPRRTGIVLEQFRAQGMVPDVEAPSFAMRGGEVEPGFEVEISSSQGIVYYTLDGSDPREVGGAPNPAARIAGGTAREKLLDANASARAWVPESGALGSAWIDPDFDDSTWIEGATGVGFERATGYEDLIGLDLIDAMDGKSASAYIRIPFDVDAATLASIERAILAMKYDDGFVAYLGGVEIARRNAPAPLAWDSQATMPNTDASAVVFEEIPLASTEHLRAGRNVLAIHGLNSSPTSNDFLILPEILIETDESDGQGIVLDETTLVRARARDGDEWSALAEAVYSIDPGLRITEIHYHPPAPLGESPFGADEFEFIEIQNVSDRTLLLDGWRFVEGIEFDFSESSIAELEPGGVIVLVENLVAFETRYDATTIGIAGEYSGRLANSGETLRIVGRYGEVVIEVAYDDSWKETDGGGYSLEPVDLGAPRNVFVDPASWRAGAALFGTPGFVEGAEPSGGRQIPGDLNQDGRLDLSDPVALLGFLFVGAPARLPCGSGDLSSPANRALLDATGDDAVGLTDAIRILGYLFRGDEPPVLGTACTEIPGCPGACAN